MGERIKVAFATGTEEQNERLVAEMAKLYPELPLYLVSELPIHHPAVVKWIPYHILRGFRGNYSRLKAMLRGKRVRLAGVLLVPKVPTFGMRFVALALAPAAFLGFNENFNSWMFRPRSAPNILRHLRWRVREFVHFQTHAGGDLYTWLWRFAHPRELRVPLFAESARVSGMLGRWCRRLAPAKPAAPVDPAVAPAGISVVIPSRNGKDLLAQGLPGVLRDLAGAGEVIVVDNGSGDATAAWLAAAFPEVRVEVFPAPLAFAEAANRGIAAARFSHVCLLNNDMVIEPGFFAALRAAFDSVPGLFCATAQIFFPPGVRREETGKAMLHQPGERDFPVRCLPPVEGEDGSYVLYGSGGCSLYDAGKLRALGGFDEIYKPAYVEDLDLGWRGWQRGWPSVFVAGARVEHRHRATTSRYFTPLELGVYLELNYVRFLCRAVASPAMYQRLWRQARWRLHLLSVAKDEAAVVGLHSAGRPKFYRPPRVDFPEEQFAALCDGRTAVFPGRAASGKPVVLIASPYLPFPLSHGGAVRMYNLMRRAAEEFDLVLLSFCDALATPPREILDLCCETVLVTRKGSHYLRPSDLPDVVLEFESEAFRAALRLGVRKWRPAVVQLEFTQLAQYAPDCAPAPAMLVEHDITIDLYEQLLRHNPEDYDLQRQVTAWARFETEAWKRLDAVALMSEKDRARVAELAGGERALCLPNGVDLERYRPGARDPEPARLLFIGAFNHLPNVMALAWFLDEVWPKLGGAGPTLHVIAGARHEYFLDLYKTRVAPALARPGIEIEGFVSDVRPAYERASVVIAPLVASAGTNIKILEAMAMGKAIVTTPAGINGLDVSAQVRVAASPEDFAAEILALLADPDRRRALEREARQAAERDWSWDVIARKQGSIYRRLGASGIAPRRRAGA